MLLHTRACVAALLCLVAGGASAAQPMLLSHDGAREYAAALTPDTALVVHVQLPARQRGLLRASSERIDLVLDVQDGADTYTSDSPARLAGIEYLDLDAKAEARTVVVTLRTADAELDDGDVQVQWLADDAPTAATAREWAAISREKIDDDASAKAARLARLDALRTRCADAGDARCLPDVHLALGHAYDNDRASDANAAASAAIAAYAEQGAVLGQIAAQGLLGNLGYYAGNMDDTLAAYARAAALAKGAAMPGREATYESYVAVMHLYAGNLDDAMRHYESAGTALGNRRGPLLSSMRSGMGGVHELRGDYDLALAAYQEAIDLAGDAQNARHERAMALSNLGALRADVGQKQQAILLLAQSLAEFRALDDLGEQARVLSILAYQFQVLRRPHLAEPLIRNAIAICARRQHAHCAADTSATLAWILWQGGRMDEAAVAYAEASRLTDGSASSYAKALLAYRLAQFHLARGDIESAAAVRQAAMDDPGVAQMKRFRFDFIQIEGSIRAARGEDAAARAQFDLIEAADPGDFMETVYSHARIELARLDAKAGKWDDVERRARIEIDRTAQMRQEFHDPLSRADFLATRQEAYELLIRARLAKADAGDATALRDAFDIDERSRSRGLLDALASIDAAGDTDSDLAHARDALRRKQLALKRLLAGSEPPDAERADALRTDIAIARVALEAQEARTFADRRSALGKPRTIDEVQATLTSDREAVLMYRLRDSGSWVWVVTRDTLRRVPLPEAKTITQRVDRFVAELRNGKDAGADARWLYDTLVAATALPATVTQVLVVPDGALQRLPFVALEAPDGRFLVETLQLSMLPSTSVGIVLGQQLRTPRDYPQRDVVVFADPIFTRDDPRLSITGAGALVANTPAGVLDDLLGQQLMRSGGIETLPRLPGTAREADAMRDAFGDTRVRVFQGLEATLDAARGDVARNARILHFATHGLVDPLAPELTGLALSRWQEEGAIADGDGFLSLPLIGETRFNAELVILSACDSAVGRDVESEGLIGVSRSFLAAGAGSVIATLWPVSDREAARLDARLATEMQAGASAGQALQRAQREAIADPQRRRNLSWAAFGFYGPLAETVSVR